MTARKPVKPDPATVFRAPVIPAAPERPAPAAPAAVPELSLVMRDGPRRPKPSGPAAVSRAPVPQTPVKLSRAQWDDAVALFRDGESEDEICDRYGITRIQLILRVRGDMTSAEWAEAMQRYVGRESVEEIAEDYGITRAQLIHHARTLGLSRPPRALRPGEVDPRGPVHTWPRIPLARVNEVLGVKRGSIYARRNRGSSFPDPDEDGCYEREMLFRWARRNGYAMPHESGDQTEAEPGEQLQRAA